MQGCARALSCMGALPLLPPLPLHRCLLPCQAPPARERAPRCWAILAAKSTVLSCFSTLLLCLKGSLILVMEPGYQPEGAGVWEAEAREANWGVAPPPTWGS